MQQLSYCQDSKELREMYANLLASSMNADKKWNVHPAFVDIIKQLNPDEAKILKSLAPNSSIYYPMIDVKMKISKGYINIYRNFAIQGIDVIEQQGLINSYIDNLCRLDLIEIPPIIHLMDESRYIQLENHPIVKAIKKQSNIEDSICHYEHKCFNLTDFGVNFIETCC